MSSRPSLFATCAGLLCLAAAGTSCAALEEMGVEFTGSGGVVTKGPATATPVHQAAPSAMAPTGAVMINGRALGSQEIQAIRSQYGVDPLPGSYWYDSRSGAFGMVGQPVTGLMLPGHDFGLLDPNASAGTTGIYLNGRNLTHAEALFLAQFTGAAMPGRYWLDAHGNLGHEGHPQPVMNLAQAAATQPGAGGGDNFWSSRFAAGNWNDQGQGYVSVPGHGPIGYGF